MMMHSEYLWQKTIDMRAVFTTIFGLAFSVFGSAQMLIPAHTSTAPGHQIDNLSFNSYSVSDKRLIDEVDVYNQFRTQLNDTPLREESQGDNRLVLRYDADMQNEAYRISAMTGNSVEIAGGESGVFYGLMTLLQWQYAGKSGQISGGEEMHDAPAFAWRGVHLDVSRHFFPISFVKKYIDVLALYKMNTFHWHLTDDQGWRIEIKKYPLLTQIGSSRKETIVDKNFEPFVGDGKPVSGFYTQAEIKEIVQYASQRHITVVPEIEMPGHAQAALAAYPEYSCRKTSSEVLTKWGEGYDVFCTDEKSIRFLEDILDEVFALFPSTYIHIGGDEVSKKRWKECPVCQKNCKDHHLKNEEELQSYFIRQIDAYITQKGRQTIGWDEILEGGLAPNAAVMSWRGVEGGIAAARLKHKVVMSPGTHCYFDHYQGNPHSEPLAIGGFTPVEKVYAYKPIPDSLHDEERNYVQGAQANLWTEYMATEQHVEYMLLPRLCALSEVLWTGDNRPGFADFSKRLRGHFDFLSGLGYHYSPSIFDVSAESVVQMGKAKVDLHSTYSDGEIRYWFVGEDAKGMNTYQGKPILIDTNGILAAQYFENDKAMGHIFTQSFLIHQALGKSITSSIEPSPYYKTGGLPALLDGKAGMMPRVSSEWLGWSGKSPDITIDLGETSSCHTLEVYTLQEENNWIYLPTALEVQLSDDGKKFTTVGSLDAGAIANAYQAGNPLRLSWSDRQARYVKLKATCAPKISEGNPGSGEDAWLFLSELALH